MAFQGFVQLVVGPAGAGKTTYCSTIKEHCDTIHRPVFLVNLDPAAEGLPFKADFDVRDLVSQADVMPSLKLGPNGALVFCFEYLAQNLEILH